MGAHISTRPLQLKHLVLTFCSGYSFAVYERFVESLFQTVFQCRLVMFISQSDIPTVQPLQKKYADKFEYIACTWSFHPQTFRYFLYKTYLQNLIPAPDLVFICDSRDVLFQKNIFDYPLSPDIALWLFAEDMTIGQDAKWNSKWLQQVDADSLPLLAQQRILCSGTTMGRYLAMMIYLNLMTTVVKQRFLSKNRAAELGAVDQGIHNFIAYRSELLTAELYKQKLQMAILTNEDDLIHTIGVVPKHSLDVNEEGRVILKPNRISCCVHQYDRLNADLLYKLGQRTGFNVV